MYLKNTASQFIGFTAINASTGATMTGTTGFAAYRVIDGGAQASATGSVTDKTNGQYSFALSQADTNGNDISILFTMTGMVAVEKTFLTVASPGAAIAALILTTPANLLATDASGRISLNLAQTLAAFGSALTSSTADTALTVNEALHCAIASVGGQQTTSGTAYTTKTSAGTTVRAFTLDQNPSPSNRT